MAAVSTRSPAKAWSQVREVEVGRHDRRAALVPRRHDLEEQVRLVAGERQVADLVDDQQRVPAETLHQVGQAVLAHGGSGPAASGRRLS